MIKALILDIDGVIVGEKIDYNSPWPHPAVIARLKSIEASGIPISLCTAKPHFAIRRIIDDAGLRNLHITDGGAVIIDPLDDVILETHLIPKDLARQVVQTYLDHDVHTEIYTVDEYVIDQSQNTGPHSQLTNTHSHILQTEPHVVTSLAQSSDDYDICKIMPIAADEADKARLIELFEPFADDLTLSWGIHPIDLPRQFGIITARGISKQQAALAIAKHSSIHLDELLGIGDSTSDWQFIEPCGYAGTVANATPELKHLIASKGLSSHIGGSVDANGVLDIFDYFGLK